MKKIKKEFKRYIESVDVDNQNKILDEAKNAMTAPKFASFRLSGKSVFICILLLIMLVSSFSLGMAIGLWQNGEFDGASYKWVYINEENIDATAAKRNFILPPAVGYSRKANAYFRGRKFAYLNINMKYLDKNNLLFNEIEFIAAEPNIFPAQEIKDLFGTPSKKLHINGVNVFYLDSEERGTYIFKSYFVKDRKEYFMQLITFDEFFFTELIHQMLA